MIYTSHNSLSEYVPVPYSQQSCPPDERVCDSLTGQFLHQCGLRAGMRVLNLGCGAGNAALLAAALVGPTGCVFGIDRDARAVVRARRRAASAHLANLRLVVAEYDAFESPEPFDALIGRFALGSLASPAATLRRLSRLVRPGGLIAFQEVCLPSNGPLALSAATTLRQRPASGERWAEQAVETGAQLFTLFLRAGLPAPRMVLGAWADVGVALSADEPALVGAYSERRT